jgi:hypothetical protein
MSNEPQKPVSDMTAAEFQRSIENRAWLPKPEAAPVLSPEEIALRRKIVLNLPAEQFEQALKLKAWNT